MPKYEEFMMRHGDIGVQFIVEQIEHIENARVPVGATLEDRWVTLMQVPVPQESLAA